MAKIEGVELGEALNRREVQRSWTVSRDRWPIEMASLGGAQVADEHGEPQRERGPEFVVVLVSSGL